jgi:hypothetical protein
MGIPPESTKWLHKQRDLTQAEIFKLMHALLVDVASEAEERFIQVDQPHFPGSDL